MTTLAKIKAALDVMYPPVFLRETSYGKGIMERGKQEPTYIRRLRSEELTIVNDIEKMLYD